MGSFIAASGTALLGGYGIAIGFCARAACCCSRCHRKEGCCGLFGRALPDEPLNTLPLRVLLSRLPISQEVSESKGSLDDRLRIARGTVRQASLCSCSVSKVTGDSCAASACQETAAMLIAALPLQRTPLCCAGPQLPLNCTVNSRVNCCDSCLIRWFEGQS